MNSLTNLIRTKSLLLFVILLLTSIAVVVATSFFSMVVGALAMVIILGSTAIIITYERPLMGLFIAIFNAFFLPFFTKVFYLYTVPIGTVLEATNIAVLLVLIIKGRLEGFKTLSGYFIVAWLTFSFLELLNPLAASRVAWFFAIRSVLSLVVIYYVAVSVIRTKNDILNIYRFFISLTFLAALYTLYQEFVGFPTFDLTWIHASENRFDLLFNWGQIRKFSFFYGPTELGLVLSFTSIICYILFFSDLIKPIEKMLVVCAGFIILWALIYTGSRTSTILVPVGIFFVTLILFKRSLIIAFCLGAILATGLVLKPTSNQALFVMLTALEGSDDPSLNVRLENQKLIQKYVQEAPIGYGLGSTGDIGRRFTPGSFIGSFPPDSEYVKIAIETGYIGLFIWCVLQFLFFKRGVDFYFELNNENNKFLIAIPVSLLFMNIVAQYPQEVYRMPVLAMLFAVSLAIIERIGLLQHKL